MTLLTLIPALFFAVGAGVSAEAFELCTVGLGSHGGDSADVDEIARTLELVADGVGGSSHAELGFLFHSAADNSTTFEIGVTWDGLIRGAYNNAFGEVECWTKTTRSICFSSATSPWRAASP